MPVLSHRLAALHFAAPFRRRSSAGEPVSTSLQNPVALRRHCREGGQAMDTGVERSSNTPDYSTAYFFLEGLCELGIEYLFCNFGTDHAPIIEEIANRRKPCALQGRLAGRSATWSAAISTRSMPAYRWRRPRSIPAR
jgi:hypothetical protein